MLLLESEVVSVLETLVKDTVKEMTTFVDLSGITLTLLPPLTETTANESVTLDYTVSEQKVYEMTKCLLASCYVCL